MTDISTPAAGPDSAPDPDETQDPTEDRSDPDGLTAEMALVREQIAALGNDVRGYRSLIEELHVQNEELRRGTFERMLEPILRDLIKILEDQRRLALTWESRETAAVSDVRAAYTGAGQDLEMLLERYGVEQVVPEPGLRFDRREHRAVESRPATDPELDETVEHTRDPGYRVGQKVLRFPNVVLHRYVPGPDAGSEDTSDTEPDQQDDGE
jgi:molecular chaperone GrpE (heat shock protein)